MEAYLIDWFSLFGRWLHMITGIAWIGSSFYFVWLDNHLLAPRDERDVEQGVGGEVWSVHGGGFYHAQKYRVAPSELPAVLHWFKWEAYSTWLSGIFLMALIYWYGAEVYLIDSSLADLSRGVAVSIGIGALVAGWVIYDLLCRSPLGRNDRALGAAVSVLTAVAAWGLCQVFSGLGAFIHFGAMLGTIMVANVFFVIIPGQRALVEATRRGETPDPAPGIKAKQRSVHNTYFTLPVLFVMISNHYATTFGHEYNWIILLAISLAGALIRVYFVARHSSKPSPLPLVAAGTILLAVMFAAVPRPSGGSAAETPVSFAEVRRIIENHCVDCHSQAPTHVAFPAAPAGVMLDSTEQIVAEATRIYQQTVVVEAMPIGNLTGMQDDERAAIANWYHAGAKAD